MSDQDGLIKGNEQYIIAVSLPEKRMTAGVRAEIPLTVHDETNFNQILYIAVQKEVDENSPLNIPPGNYVLYLDAQIIERKEVEEVEESELPPIGAAAVVAEANRQAQEELTSLMQETEDQDEFFTQFEGTTLNDLVERSEALEKPVLPTSRKDKGKGRKAASPRRNTHEVARPTKARRK